MEKLDGIIFTFSLKFTEEQLADILTKGVSKKVFFDSYLASWACSMCMRQLEEC